ESTPQGTVQHPVPVADDDPAKNLWVHLYVRDHLPAQHLRQVGGDLLLEALVRLVRQGDLRVQATQALVQERVVLTRDLPEEALAPLVQNHHQEVQEERRHAILERMPEYPLLLFGFHLRRLEEGSEHRLLVQEPRELVHRRGEVFPLTVALADLEERLGVVAGDRRLSHVTPLPRRSRRRSARGTRAPARDPRPRPGAS